jgi:hypothetical protein
MSQKFNAPKLRTSSFQNINTNLRTSNASKVGFSPQRSEDRQDRQS